MPISASLRSRGARTGTAVAAALAVAGFGLAGAPAAFAQGESGDIEIRSADHSRGKHRENDTVKVCEFKLVATNFETLMSVAWVITEQPPAVPPNVLTGTLALSGGEANSQEYRLPDGTYQLTWTAPVGGTAKMKTFEVDCSHEGKDKERHGSKGSEHHEDKKDDGKKDEGSSWSGSDKDYDKPSGAVPAGGGGVPTMEGVSSESDSGLGATTTALAAGAAGLAGLFLVRRSARRRARGEA